MAGVPRGGNAAGFDSGLARLILIKAVEDRPFQGSFTRVRVRGLSVRHAQSQTKPSALEEVGGARSWVVHCRSLLPFRIQGVVVQMK